MHSPLSTPLATTSSKRAAASLEPHDRLLLMMHTEGLHPQGVTQRSASTLPTPIVPSDRAEIPRFPELQFCQGPLLPSWAHPVLGLSSGAGWALLIASHPFTEGSEELYQSAPSAVLAHRPANSPVDWGSVPIQPTTNDGNPFWPVSMQGTVRFHFTIYPGVAAECATREAAEWTTWLHQSHWCTTQRSMIGALHPSNYEQWEPVFGLVQGTVRFPFDDLPRSCCITHNSTAYAPAVWSQGRYPYTPCAPPYYGRPSTLV
jgi:hypothetical protein